MSGAPALYYDIQGSESWPTPNLIDPPVYSTLLPSSEYLSLSLATLLIGGRLVSRGYLLKTLGLDDLFIVIALVFALIITVSNMLLLSSGFGRHTWDVDPKEVQNLLFHVWLSQWTPAIATMFTKLSIVCFYLRFVMGRTARRACFITMIFTCVWSVAIAIAWMCRCVPSSFWWKGGEGKCISLRWTGILTAWQMALNLLTHLILLVLPMSTLWKLQMHWARKVGLVVLLGFGLTCCIFGSLRLQATYKTLNLTDPSWQGYQVLMLQYLEVLGGIIYACVPFLKPITLRLVSPVRSIVQRRSKASTFGSTNASSNSTSPSIAIAKSVTIQNQFSDRGPRRVRVPSPLDMYDADLEECNDEYDWADEKVEIGVQSKCVSNTNTANQPTIPEPTKQMASTSLVSMSTIATDGTGMKNEDTELAGLSPAQIPKPRTSNNVQRI